MNGKKRFSRILIGLLLVPALLSGCERPTESVPELLEPVGVTVDTEKVTRGSLVVADLYEGSLTACISEIAFQIDGVIKEIRVYPGQEVRACTVLMNFDLEKTGERIDALKENIEYIEASGKYTDQINMLKVELAQAEYDEAAAAFGADSKNARIKKADLEQAWLTRNQTAEQRELELSEAQKELEKLQDSLEYQVVTAPQDGHVYYDNVRPGTYVQAGKTVAYVTDPGEMRFVVRTNLSPYYLEGRTFYAVVEGKRYELIPEFMSDEEKISIILSNGTISTSFRPDPSQDLSALSAGQFGMLFVEKEHLEDVLQVPSDALGYDGLNGYYVYVMENGARVKRYVKAGTSDGVMTEIREGLEEGEVVYVQN